MSGDDAGRTADKEQGGIDTSKIKTENLKVARKGSEGADELVLYAERKLEELRMRQGGSLTAEQRTDKWQFDFRLKARREFQKMNGERN